MCQKLRCRVLLLLSSKSKKKTKTFQLQIEFDERCCNENIPIGKMTVTLIYNLELIWQFERNKWQFLWNIQKSLNFYAMRHDTIFIQLKPHTIIYDLCTQWLMMDIKCVNGLHGVCVAISLSPSFALAICTVCVHVCMHACESVCRRLFSIFPYQMRIRTTTEHLIQKLNESDKDR